MNSVENIGHLSELLLPKPLQQQMRRGETLDQLLKRFLSKVAIDGAGCWIWLGHWNRQGYGNFRVGGRHVAAHRVAHQLFIGPIPDGLTIDHLCRVTSCVNPLHLEAVTMRENTLRGQSPTVLLHHAGTCIKGHPIAGDNTIGKGRVRCRQCAQERTARYNRSPLGRATKAAAQRRHRAERKAVAS